LISIRVAGVLLAMAAGTFWLSWVLMPGVGVVDAARILELVAQQRGLVTASVVVQLLSSVLFVPGLIGVSALARVRGSQMLEVGSTLLMIGALGSAADAIFHLAAYEMTHPSAAPAAMLPVMERLQTGGVRFLAPFVLAFFAGSIVLATAMGRERLVARLCPLLACVGVALLPVSGLFSLDATPHRLLALAGLGLVSAAVGWSGIGLGHA
jgi:hypothetical protein